MNDSLNSILLIDDDPMVHFLNEKVVQKSGYTVDTISLSGAQKALELIEKESIGLPSLIFLDLNMPGLSGWDFLERFAKIPLQKRKGITIIILSTSENPRDQARAEQSSLVKQYITKPLSKNLLRQIVEDQWPATPLKA